MFMNRATLFLQVEPSPPLTHTQNTIHPTCQKSCQSLNCTCNNFSYLLLAQTFTVVRVHLITLAVKRQQFAKEINM